MKKIILSIILSASTYLSFSQGCSDAGFCSIGSVANNTEANTAKTQLNKSFKLGSSFGIGEQEITVVTPYLQYEQALKNNWQVQLKATYNSASKNEFSTSDFGDIFFVVTKSWKHKKDGNFIANLGLKLPLGNDDKKSNGQNLPLAFQSTLGTTDIIAGLTYQLKNWDFSAAAQIPLNKTNSNSFIEQPANATLNKFVSTRNFNRSSDVLLRGTRKFILNKKATLNGGLLAIYHLGNDAYTDLAGNTKIINESEGLTLNFTTSFGYQISNKLFFNLSAGTPLVVRTQRPDGLTRSLVIVPEIKYVF